MEKQVKIIPMTDARYHSVVIKLRKNFEDLIADVDYLFEVDVDKNELWDLYLDSHPVSLSQIFMKRREADCSCCQQFVKNIGNVVAIKDREVFTIWGFDCGDEEYQIVFNALDQYIKSHDVVNRFIASSKVIGTPQNFSRQTDGTIQQWEHFAVEIPRQFLCGRNETEDTMKAQYRDMRNVFKRSLDEISANSITSVLELIAAKSLYKGEEWKGALTKFLAYKKEYDKYSDEKKELFAWETAGEVGEAISKIRNHSMGVLLTDISNNVNMETAVRKYESIVAPQNYKRSQGVFTAQMLERAQKKLQEEGYMSSLQRRHATLDDITVNNILFSNKDSAKRIQGNDDIFGDMLKMAKPSPRKFDRVEEIDVENFVKDVLPLANEVEVYLENKHEANMVSLIAPKNVEAPTMFKWNNGFSWAYSGNITDSAMKERVKAAGGKVDGVLRFSIQWNDLDMHSDNDLDAHCIEPLGDEIYFGHKVSSYTKGNLDVDIIHPQKGKPAVENITWPSLQAMSLGQYQFLVHQYFNRGGRDGFRAEIEFEGQIYSFNYPREVRQGERIPVATVTLDRSRHFSIQPAMEYNASIPIKELWGLKTNEFIPVSVVMYSPNYWDEQTGIGNKHYFFMLKDCVNPEKPNGFYNEFLKNELIEHRQVLETLGSRMSVEAVEDQLSGIGFSSTKRNTLIVKVIGSVERILKVKF